MTLASEAAIQTTRRLTGTQVELLRLFASGVVVAVVREKGPRQACRMVPNLLDYRWRRRHGGKPVGEHTLAGLVRRGFVVRTMVGVWVIWRLRE